MLNIIEQKVRSHPFSDIDDLREFIDKLFEDLLKGRSEDTIKTGKAHRASV